MLNKELIDKAILLDKRMKQDKKELDRIKSVLQGAALSEMDNKNIKYIESFGTTGSAFVTYTEKVEIDNYNMLIEVAGPAIIDKIKREEAVKYNLDSKAKKALSVIYKGDYAEHDIKSLLVELGLGDDKIKVALKKLKGDYSKDKAVLESFGLDATELEEELDAIREQKNFELINKYFDEPGSIDIKKLQRALSIEEGLSIGLVYDED